MKRTLYFKFLAGYVVFGILGFLAVATFTTRATADYIKESTTGQLYKEANMIASTYAQNYYKNALTVKEVQNHLRAIDTYLDASIWIVNTSGKILINSREDTDINNLREIDGFDMSSFGNKYYQVGDFFKSCSEECLTVYSPITINYRKRGYVLIHKATRQLAGSSNAFINISYVTLAIVFLCALIVLIIFTYTVYVPIRKITKAADAYAAGNFDWKLENFANDEIGYLAASLHYMATELNTLEDDQRKFIANISHDFRSPLTSIKGYVEAIMDGTIPIEAQDKYLGIIVFETERLNKLSASMLELNKYGVRGSMLDVSNFDINHTIKTTVRSFEGTCKEKRISFELILTGQTLFISADVMKIQQVLYNLIDNAIRFSHPDSMITIETTEKNEKVFISVKDTGVGIPKESLKKIWERFYKTDVSRGKDKKGTGLGLSIVKDIIQVHNENINVISTEGVGTEFIFTLPIAKRSEN
ncbi:HAMP domain-containing histidine kinase [Lachnospiraceae bacterium ZAX-1]